ncbi:nicotinamide riboside kinase 1 isoform X1 [Daktulosphaira vitifoliae]|uniref:nicotinamide riboside kinase 1 isoform X1 n=1 Tax=Daktulosphaira vitifoliae TaxID=58002 RepID=UPI0021A9D991|nr:nicotinamide riboside kinase 1 isoform X1 [Daktulosphaira vitifoliae]
MSKRLVVVIAGVTCGGKSSIASKLFNIFDSVSVFHQDEFYYSDYDTHLKKIPELNYHNWDEIGAYNMDQMVASVACTSLKNLIILEGILLLDDARIVKFADLKFFIIMDKETCWNRRCKRQYLPPEPDGYFENYAWPQYEKHLTKVKENNSDVIFLNGTDSLEHNVAIVMDIIKNKLDEFYVCILYFPLDLKYSQNFANKFIRIFTIGELIFTGLFLNLIHV